MCFFFSFIPATIVTTLSYFVWYAAGKAEGNQQRWGNYLAVWLLIVALGYIAMGAYVTFADICPLERLFGGAAGV
jgi:hypothetical protein